MRMVDSDFLFSAYGDMLNYIAQHYECCDFENYKKSDTALIWRHDIDFSVSKALDLARLESQLGIRANYFFLLRGSHYNLFDSINKRSIREIKELGHAVGLHFDPLHYGEIKDESRLEKHLYYEKRVFEKELGLRVNTFAYHNTSPEILTFNKDSYAGLINVYGKTIREGIPYCSDSYGIWRFQCLPELLKQKQNGPLHVLTHPELWTETAMSPRNRLKAFFDEKSKYYLDEYDGYIQAHMPELWKHYEKQGANISQESN